MRGSPKLDLPLVGTALLERLSELAQTNREFAVHIWHDQGSPTPDDWTAAQADSFFELLAETEGAPGDPYGVEYRDDLVAHWLAMAPFDGYVPLQGSTQMAAEEAELSGVVSAVLESASPEDALAIVRAHGRVLAHRFGLSSTRRWQAQRRVSTMVERRPARVHHRGGRRRSVSRRVTASRGSPSRSSDGEPPHLARREVAA